MNFTDIKLMTLTDVTYWRFKEVNLPQRLEVPGNLKEIIYKFDINSNSYFSSMTHFMYIGTYLKRYYKFVIIQLSNENILTFINSTLQLAPLFILIDNSNGFWSFSENSKQLIQNSNESCIWKDYINSNTW